MNGATRVSGVNVPPPRLAEVRRARGGRWLVIALGAMAVGAALFVFDPARHRFFPLCLFHAVTGLNCPGCGGTRAVHHLLHGDVAAALRCNALVVLALPAGALAALALALKPSGASRWRQRAARWLPWALVAVATVFGVVRNLPGGAWLSP